MGEKHPLANMAFLGPQSLAETLEPKWERKWKEQLFHIREMDEEQEDVASLTNRDVSASRNRVQFGRWFLALMQAQRRPDQTQHETPVESHPCFFNRCRSKGGKDSGTLPRRLDRRFLPEQCRTLTVLLCDFGQRLRNQSNAFTPPRKSLPFAYAPRVESVLTE